MSDEHRLDHVLDEIDASLERLGVPKFDEGPAPVRRVTETFGRCPACNGTGRQQTSTYCWWKCPGCQGTGQIVVTRTTEET